MNVDRRGFTLVELIIVTVLGALVVAVSLQILITNQRTYTAQTAQIQGQQATRAAMDVLFNELREISAQAGDLITMNQYSLTVRSMRNFGVVCTLTTANPPVLTVLKVGSWFATNDSVFVFADNNTSIASDDKWVAVKVTSIDTTGTCSGQKAEKLNFAGQSGKFTKPAGDSVRTGAPVRSYVRYTYGLVTQEGKTYLARTDVGGTVVPLVGPLKPSSGVEFTYLDSNSKTTAVATNVRQIRVKLRTTSVAINSVGAAVADSITAVIYTRN